MTKLLTRLVAVLSLLAGAAQAQQCMYRPNESPANKERRVQAVNAVRLINSAEVQHRFSSGSYVGWDELRQSQVLKEWNEKGRFGTILPDAAGEIIPGFVLRMTTTKDGYNLSLSDKTDPCHLAFISDQVGVIYQAYPIDVRLEPSIAEKRAPAESPKQPGQR